MSFRSLSSLIPAVLVAQVSFAQWQILDAPGSTGTLLESIHNGVLVGTRSAYGVVSGTTYDSASGNWANSSYYAPNSSSTWFYGNYGNTIVGEIRESPSTHKGLIYQNESSAEIFQPDGSLFTTVRGISGRLISGYYSTGSGYKGFIKDLDQTGYQTIENPMASNTYAEDIDGEKVAGWYQGAGGRNFGFLYQQGQWKTLAMDGAEETKAYGVYGDLVVGYFRDSSNLTRGFLYNDTDESWTILDAPGATATIAKDVGLDSNGSVAVTGYFYDGTFVANYGYQEKGFLTVPEPTSAGMILLATALFVFKRRTLPVLKS